MNVDRIVTVMKVSGRTVLPEKVGSVELEPASDARFELRCLGVPADGLQRAQVVSGVKVVDPSLCRGLPVVPRAIFVLQCGCVAGNPEGRTEEFGLARVLVHTAEESGTKEVRVVSLNPQWSERIAEACNRATFHPIEFVHDVLRRTHGHPQAP